MLHFGMKGIPMSLENIRENVERFWRAAHDRDVDAILTCFAAGAIAHDPVGSPPLETPEQLRAHFSGALSPFKTLAVSADMIKVCGDHSATRWSIKGTTAEGSPLELEGIDVTRHDEDGKIVSLMGFF